MITEDYKFSSNAYWYHGSANGKLDKIYKPSVEHPFFVTSSLGYAIQYMSFDTANGDKPTSKKNGKFVACKLSKNVKVFDLTNKDDYAKLHLPKIIQMLFSKKVNAWATFWYLVGSKLQLKQQLDSNKLQEIANRIVHKIIELRQFKLSADDVRQLREWLLSKIDNKHLYAFELKDDNLDRCIQYKIIAQMFFNDIAKLGYDACMNDEDGAIALAILDIAAIDTISAKFMTYDEAKAQFANL